MHFAFIVIFIVFLLVAPKVFRALLALHVATAVVAIIVLVLIVWIDGIFTEGSNAKLYGNGVYYWFIYVNATAGTMLLGIAAGVIMKVFAHD